MLKRGSLVLLTCQGELLTLITCGCSVEFGPAEFIPLHPLITYRWAISIVSVCLPKFSLLLFLYCFVFMILSFKLSYFFFECVISICFLFIVFFYFFLWLNPGENLTLWLCKYKLFKYSVALKFLYSLTKVNKSMSFILLFVYILFIFISFFNVDMIAGVPLPPLACLHCPPSTPPLVEINL